ncbi:hypothetical protein [Roseococcus pinisoli]|uniref:Uncharacterized protein n=1 Tax=Roseococcus pinisoli TaxID=2835040 RepID=A0ABS5QBZ0_9PROT|nr:hypothetical protein [Roseococcus pinisoli]MBS7811212.1 hypothetical protein [Roseococcus pinisoli]
MSGTQAESQLFLTDPQAAAVLRRRRLADELLRGAQQQPIRSHTQGLAALLQQGLATWDQVRADREMQEIGTRNREGAADFNRGLIGLTSEPTAPIASAPQMPAPAVASAAPPEPAPPEAAPPPGPAIPYANNQPPTGAPPPTMYGRNASLVAGRDALTDAPPETLAAASVARLPPGQPAFNPARPGANSELPGWDAGVAPPTGRVMPLAAPPGPVAPPGPPPATPLAASLGAQPQPQTPMASRLTAPTVPSPERLMAAYAAASASTNPLIRAQAPQLLQMAQFGALREERSTDNTRADTQRRLQAENQAAERAFRERSLQLQAQGLSQQEAHQRAMLEAQQRGPVPQGQRYVNGRLEDIPGAQPRVGLTPVMGTDANGNVVPLLPNDRGQLVQPALPEGVSVTPRTREINTGTEMLTVDQGGQIVARRPINIRGREGEERIGQAQGEAAARAPQVVTSANRMLADIDAIASHPALRNTTGVLAFTGSLPGTPMADFANRVAQLQGQTFLEAFNSLRGGGQITEAEGRKATDAIGRLGRNVSPSAFRQAMQDLRDVVEAGRRRAEEAGRRAGTIPADNGGMPVGQTGQVAEPPRAGGRLRFNPETGAIE